MFNSEFIKAIFSCFWLCHFVSQCFRSSLYENATASLILQSVVLRCNFSRTGRHCNNMVGTTIILLLSTPGLSTLMYLPLLSKLAPKESKESLRISGCISSRLQGNLTIYPPAICLFLFKFTFQVVLYENKIRAGPCKSEVLVTVPFVTVYKYFIVPRIATITLLL